MYAFGDVRALMELRPDGKVVGASSLGTPLDDLSGSVEYYSDDPAGSVVRQQTQVYSGITNPALRWWLGHGPYLFDQSSESQDSGKGIETSDGMESTVSPVSSSPSLSSASSTPCIIPCCCYCLAAAIESCGELVKGYDSDAESSTFEKHLDVSDFASDASSEYRGVSGDLYFNSAIAAARWNPEDSLFPLGVFLWHASNQ
ncbi:hypothetical protein L873DRAFT_1792631 [Choiromyces venosus 120613-1]|uniref:Uncharacterized protein n=1 Tax=Choiromyces venosus 120613-1 TaxID=1336337 RepID=A0A3N4JC54_9PEZI|nr:hypothetical protein L873DRAFT_1792631 [Choiromyces venosus 120613-1]